ncbi:hypothetical protein FNV43_RR22425 [Rhamnella rubrinervis]|uniref:C2 domain-containing protein n=1 Tax=Rhamnella rubrinervis TaxID=2594499 RepID=A0A8K0DUA6_9ROSA|nr:hypothetical protein FNV43_RR22425 [Rhamnella rubrinervis]
MEMESSYLQVKLISCKDLKAFNFFQKLSVYAVVSIASDDPSKKVQEKQVQSQRTPCDSEGDGNPEWNHELRFDLKGCDEYDGNDHLFLQFNLRHQGMAFGFGDKTIGEVRIPLKDMMEEACYGVVRFVSYQVRNTDGKPNGVLNLSYKYLNGKPIKSTDPAGCGSSSSTTTTSTIHGDGAGGNKIQYPSVQLEPVALPIPLVKLQTNQSQNGEYNYWPRPPLGLDCWSSHPPYPMMFPSQSYYHAHTPPPRTAAPFVHLSPSRPLHQPYLMAAEESHGYDYAANGRRASMPMAIDGELGHASFWNDT